jgi:predicted dehydrogenase
MKRQAPITTVLCGMGGFGQYYLTRLLDGTEPQLQLSGCVDPRPESSPLLGRVREAGVPVCESLDQFYAQSSAELAILSSPIQFHCGQTLLALSRGSHVLCEKPLCATIDEARRMIEAQRRSGLVLAVGYQGSFLESTQRLKADILAGTWGRPLSFRCIALWPRGREYYLRNSWAGRVRDDDGRPVMDSPVNNATAHFLHHMLYLLGDSRERSAVPEEVESQLYRAHAIENYDTAILRCRTSGGAEVFFVTTHTGTRQCGPIFELIFEGGRVDYRISGNELTCTGPDDIRRSYGACPHHGWEKVTDTVAAIREGRESLCGAEAAMSQTLCMSAAQESGSPVVRVPEALTSEVEFEGERLLEVAGLAEVLEESFRSARLPETAAASWIRASRPVRIDESGEGDGWRNERGPGQQAL